ncbi:MAG: hypothetical protein EBW49_08370 [Betaproteobacteria bacterium]|nr:hypothetical protein [Betaproteobacteria bacterium]
MQLIERRSGQCRPLHRAAQRVRRPSPGVQVRRLQVVRDDGSEPSRTGAEVSIVLAERPESRIQAFTDDQRRMIRDRLEREVRAGHDGTWVAHPGLVSTALEAFAALMPGPNQLHVMPEGTVTADDLLRPLPGPITEQGVRWNLHVGVRYLEAWLGGSGAEPIHHLMEAPPAPRPP